MQLQTHHRSRTAVGVAVAAAAAGATLLATPAAAADPAADIRCHITVDGATSQLGVYCFDDVTNQQATFVDYQWERDGVAIPGATGSTYQYQSADMGHLFSATVGVDRAGTRATVPLGRASAPEHQALYLMDGCNVEVSQRFGNPGGRNLLDGADLNDTLTLTLDTEVASNLTVDGPYWTMATSSGSSYVLPPALAGQGQGWTVTLSDLASIDAILEQSAVNGRGWAVVKNSFTVSAGDVSATVDSCPWGPDTPMGLLNDGVFTGTSQRTPAFPIAGHTAGDTGVQGVLTADTSGWAPKGAPGAATFTYQWTRDGQLIDGAVSDSYTLTADDSGKKIGLVIWGTVDPTTAWIWGEVTAGEIKAPAATASPTESASAAAAGSGQTSAATSTAAASGAKTPSSLASTGSTVVPVVIVAVLLLAAGAVALVVRRRAHQLG